MNQKDRDSKGQLILPASQDVKWEEIKLLESGEFTEEQLERALIVVPELISPEPFICGRQLPTDSGPIDLFGFGGMSLQNHTASIQSAKFPNVYELKAGRIRRDALIQVLDYSMRLEDMTAEDLAWHIVRNAGKPGAGIARIWKPEVILKAVEEAWTYGRIVWKVVIGTTYDSHVGSMASRLDIKLYTVGELCAGYRERFSRAK